MSEAAESKTLTREELEQLCAAANLGDQQARSRLCRWLDANPGTWQAVAAAGTQSELQLRYAITAGKFLEQECLRRSTDALKASLLPADATQLEVLAAERVCVSWLGLQLAELRMASVDGASTRSTFWVRAADSAHRRFSGALSQFQAIQKVLGRAPCRAAVADVLAGATRTQAAAEGSSPTSPAPQPTVPPAAQDLAPGETAASSVPTDSGPVGPPDSRLPDFSSTVPFRMHRPGPKASPPEGARGDMPLDSH